MPESTYPIWISWRLHLLNVALISEPQASFENTFTIADCRPQGCFPQALPRLATKQFTSSSLMFSISQISSTVHSSHRPLSLCVSPFSLHSMISKAYVWYNFLFRTVWQLVSLGIVTRPSNKASTKALWYKWSGQKHGIFEVIRLNLHEANYICA